MATASDLAYNPAYNPEAPLPSGLQLEVTAACNLRCHMCLVRYKPPVDRVSGSLGFDAFRAIVDGNPATRDITLQGLGEPLLAPDIVDMVRYAAARGIKVGFNTNATVLTRTKAQALIDAGLDWLVISLDGATAATYESIRDGASFDRVVRNIEGMVEAKRAAGAERPELSVVFVAMRRNLHELPDVVRLVAGWGIPSLSVQNLSHSFEDTADEAAYEAIRRYTLAEALWASERAEARRVFAEASRVADDLGVHLHLPHLEEHAAPRAPGEPGCTWPWRAAYVNFDGTLQPCCMVMGAERATLGNVLEDGFEATWRGEAATEFRAALLTDDPPAVCQGCSLYRGLF